jgi:aminopeptidase-like protein
VTTDTTYDHAFYSQLFDRLFPITRSITGPGLRESLAIFGEQMPLRMDGVASGTQVFDWTTPPEWALDRATLIGPDGEVIADTDRSNLHVVNYSVPIEAELSLEDLQPYLHSIPAHPHLIPYVTSYYHDRWGFCLSDNVRSQLKPGNYKVSIATKKYPGEVSFADSVLKGESEQEFLLSSYLCHPSMANNELSGPLVLLGLYDRISRWKRRRLTYRFVLLPETIGSLCYLWKHGDTLKERLVGGLVLTCLGGPNTLLNYKTSRRENTDLDDLVKSLGADGGFAIRPFTPTSGSDERQYCSAGFNLPVGQMARTVYGQYVEYHTSGDDKDLMGIDRIVDAVDRIEAVLKLHEISGRFKNLAPYGEPQLGRRNLYPSVNSPLNRTKSSDSVLDNRTALNRILTVLNYSDGEHRMLDIARRLECDLVDLEPIIERLEEEKLLELAPQ